MAKASKVLLPPVPPSFTVTLELSKEEAETILSILYKVGGSPTLSRRKYAQAVLHALQGHVACGVLDMSQSAGNGSIYFKDSIAEVK